MMNSVKMIAIMLFWISNQGNAVAKGEQCGDVVCSTKCCRGNGESICCKSKDSICGKFSDGSAFCFMNP